MDIIKQKLQRINFLELGSSAILASTGIGLGTYFGITQGLSMVMGTFPLLMFATVSYFSGKKFKNQFNEGNYNPTRNDINSILFGRSYQKAFEKGFKNFIESSQDDEEKNYKVILLSLYCKKHHIKPSNLWSTDLSNYVDELYEKFSKNNKNPIVSLFMDLDISQVEEYLSTASIDRNRFKKVYDEFKEEGLLSYFMLESNTPLLFELLYSAQDKKLNQGDLNFFDKPDRMFPYNGIDKDILLQVLENNHQHTPIIKAYFETAKNSDKIIDQDAYQENMELINTHSFMKDLDKNLQKKENPHKKTNKI